MLAFLTRLRALCSADVHQARSRLIDAPTIAQLCGLPEAESPPETRPPEMDLLPPRSSPTQEERNKPDKAARESEIAAARARFLARKAQKSVGK